MRDAVELTLELAKPFEGLHRVGPDGMVYAYHDPVGFPTIGYGRLLSRERWAPLEQYAPITQEQAEAWLEQDIERALASVSRLVTQRVTTEQTAALADFAFNCGPGNLQISSLLRMVNRGEFFGAAEQFMRWVYAAGVKLPGLVRRRAAERDLFLQGID